MEIKFKELKKLYQDALDKDAQSFFVGDAEVLTRYAKYLIENLDNQGIDNNMVLELQEKV